MCTEFPHKLENALEHVRRAISATGSTLTLAAAVREVRGPERTRHLTEFMYNFHVM